MQCTTCNASIRAISAVKVGAENKTRFWCTCKCLHSVLNGPRQGHIVVIENPDQFSLRQRQPQVDGCGLATVFLADVAYAAFVTLQQLRGSVFGAVVDDYDFQCGHGLRQQAVKAFSDVIRTVERRHQNRNAKAIHHGNLADGG